ncbi:phage tail assembly protein [Chrysiogenes arsenatis]|uniref:phage tail assembly protein n=1 Tax=Chrysiogenes arsenatis TaxID=309797 RepID=UPI0004087743|nr:phage tail assembly protein [Chrysiogenes arsenatis]
MQINLKHPITVDGAEVKVLTMRAPRVRDELAAAKSSKMQEERDVRLLANLCEVTPETIEELHIVDFKQLQEGYRDFLV